jgi:hypothetical protein
LVGKAKALVPDWFFPGFVLGLGALGLRSQPEDAVGILIGGCFTMLEKNSVSLESWAETTLIKIDIMNIMLESDNNSRLEQPRRRMLTSQPQASHSHHLTANHCTEPLLREERIVALIRNTCLARSSNAFLLPEQTRPAHSRESQSAQCRAARALFSKHKKRMEAVHKEKRNSTADYEGSLPKGFSRILKAKSTVIRHSKLQEFYISLGDEEEHKMAQLDAEIKSSFFRPNFVKKKTRTKRQSLYF